MTIISDNRKWRLYYKCFISLYLALASVVNYARKWRHSLERHLLMTLESSFTIVTCLQYRPLVILQRTNTILTLSTRKKFFFKIDTEIEVQSFLLRRRPFWQMAMPSNFEFNFWIKTQDGVTLFSQLVILSNCHLISLSFCQLVLIFSSDSFVTLSFCGLAISSTWFYVTFKFHQFAIFSNLPNMPQGNFGNSQPICPYLLSKWHFINGLFCQLAILNHQLGVLWITKK